MSASEESYAAKKAAKARQGFIFFGNIVLFLGYVFLAIALGTHHLLNLWDGLALVYICLAAHILVAQRAWEG